MKKQKNYPIAIADEQTLELEIKERRNSLTTDRLDMSFGEIIGMYERKELVISPEFQRLYRWSEEQKTKFMESIILGIPIPPIFVAEDNNGRWELVDGLQRLSTILSFFGCLETPEKNVNNWTLEAGELLSSLEGFNAKNLPMRYLLNIKRSVCRIEIIKWDSKWDMRYELFSRLNTGGTVLTEQEIRNSIFRSGLTKFYSFIEAAVKTDDFKTITRLTPKQKKELFDQELVVRYASLVDEWNNVDMSISLHATSFMKKMLNAKKDIDDNIVSRFYSTIKLLAPLGKDAFRIKSVFSPSAYDAIMIATTYHLDYFNKHKKKLKEAVDAVKSDNEFRATRSVASSKTRTKKKIDIAMNIFSSFTE